MATFNIGQAGLDLFGKRIRDGVPHASERLPHIARALEANDHGVDIWLLQEVYGQAALNSISGVAGYQPFLAESRPKKHATGLAVLVREDWSADLLGKHRFPPLDRIEKSIANKGIMAVGVRSALGPVAVGNLHTCYDGSGEADARKKAPVLRRRQVEKAASFMSRLRDGAPVLLGGDFNFSLLGEPGNHAILTNGGWRDLREDATDHDDAGIRTWSSRNPLVREDPDYRDQDIDLMFALDDPGWAFRTRHIFTSDIVETAKGDLIPLSDHYGLLAEISAVT